jgi:hypothetical protein
LAISGFQAEANPSSQADIVVLFALVAVDATTLNGAKLSFCFDNFAGADFRLAWPLGRCTSATARADFS